MKSRKPRNHRLFELYALLKGYELIDPGNMEFIEVLEKMSKAVKVVSYHGGSLVNILACHPGTRICEVYSEWYADCFEKIAEYCDLDYEHYFYKMKKRPDLLRTTYYLFKKLEKKAYVKHFRINFATLIEFLEPKSKATESKSVDQ
jgi:capsular polysaccharide biosynthesis protein